MRNNNLHKAKRVKNDEFYTLLSSIENELTHYENYFKNKIIYCNCDNPKFSAFWEYFHLNFKKFELKKLIATYYNSEGFTYRAEYFGGDDENITRYNKTQMKKNGDFRSEECLKILDECDIVVTNPPFSLFREYVATLIEHDKKFLIIGNKNAITYRDFFILLKDDKVRLGYTNVREFIQPNGEIKKFGNIGWFTNFNTNKKQGVELQKHYCPEQYSKYDNYDAINIDKIIDIPCDYYGIMGVPITFLEKYDPNQFEIIWEGVGTTQKNCPQHILCDILHYKEHPKDGGGMPIINNKRKYARIFIKRRQKNNDL